MTTSALPAHRRRASRRRAATVASLVAMALGPTVAEVASAEEPTFTSRMTARWTPYTDSTGAVWDARSSTLGTLRSSTALEGKDIVGTDHDGLYQFGAVGVTGYSLAVPRDGSYRVTVKMAEGWWNAPGKRVFDVHAEGAPAATDVDIFAAVGKGAAHDVTFVVGVRDGRLDLHFLAKADLAIVSAIEVQEVPEPALPEPAGQTPTSDDAASDPPAPSPTPSPTPTPSTSPTDVDSPTPSKPPVASPTMAPEPEPSPSATGSPDPAPTSEAPSDDPVENPEVVQQTFVHRMSASPVDVVDANGALWKRRGPSLGSNRYNVNLVGKDVVGTDDDALYQRSVVGSKGILVPVPAAADYRVRLLLAEGYWKEPGKRVIDVVAEGGTVATDVDAVAAAGPGAAHDVVFDTRVEDGMLTIQFVSKVDQPLIAGIEVVSTDPAAAVGLPMASLIPHSDSSEFRRPVGDAPTDPNSPAIMSRLIGAIDAGKGWNAAVNAYQYNSAFYRVTPDTPRHTVGFHDCQNKGWTPHGLFDGPAYFVDVPIPDGAMPATGSDAQMGIYDPTTDSLWEFWVMRQTSGGGWEACWGGRVDDVSTSNGQFPEPFGVSASGMVMAGGVISIQEAARGEVDHALYLTATEAQKLLFSYPANRTDGRSDGPDLLREGQRLRLDPSLDVTTLGLTPFGEMVARAAQTHGFIVSDLAGAVAVATESGRQDERRTGMNPWDVLLGGPSYAALAKFPWDRVEVLPVDHGRPTG